MALAAIASLSACASWQNREPRLLHYLCQLEAVGSFGKLGMNAVVSPDRRRVSYHRDWTIELGRGLSLHVRWRDPSEVPPPRTEARVALLVPRERRAWSRFQLRRGGADGSLVYSTSPFNPARAWVERIRWHRLSAAFGNAEALHVALVRRDGAIIAQGLLPRAILVAPAEAATAIRPELEQRLANPADRCWPQTDPPFVIA